MDVRDPRFRGFAGNGEIAEQSLVEPATITASASMKSIWRVSTVMRQSSLLREAGVVKDAGGVGVFFIKISWVT
jgi:hypothetical protein